MREQHVDALKLQFKSILYLSATCDIWSRNNHSYLGVNLHYIDQCTGELKTVLIGCERFHGEHDNKTDAKKSKDMFARFEISKKVATLTTDNAGEFKCALKRYGNNYSEFERIAQDREDGYVWYDDLIVGASNELDALDCIRIADLIDENGIISVAETNEVRNSEPDFIIHELSIAAEDDSDDVPLPSRVECSAHTLNLIGKTDSFEALLNDKYGDTYGRVFTKLNMIWSSSTSSRNNGEMFDKYLDRKLIKPHRIRWNRNTIIILID